MGAVFDAHVSVYRSVIILCPPVDIYRALHCSCILHQLPLICTVITLGKMLSILVQDASIGVPFVPTPRLTPPTTKIIFVLTPALDLMDVRTAQCELFRVVTCAAIFASFIPAKMFAMLSSMSETRSNLLINHPFCFIG